jgi:hypothetical protein
MKKQATSKKNNPSPKIQHVEPVKPSKKKIAKDTTVYPATTGFHGSDKEENLNVEE